MAAAEPNTRRIVLLGKTGSGKSSLANTILGTKEFKVNDSPNSGTKKCQSETKRVNGRNVQLIDTPGVFDTDPRSTELSPEILKCIIECAPGPHAFLLVLKVEKFTVQEQAVVDIILKYFSEEALKYTTVVFSHGHALPEGKKIKDWLSQNKALKDLVQKCGGRCHVFDNKAWNNTQDEYRNNNVQVEELLKTIDTTVRENGGEYYSNELLRNVGNDNKYLTKLACVSVGVLLGALVGAAVMLLAVKEDLMTPGCSVQKIGIIASIGAVLGAPLGGWLGYRAADAANTPGEALEAVLNEVSNIYKRYFGK